MNPRERRRFDRLLEEVLDALPPRVHELLAEVPLIVDDRPSPDLLEELTAERSDYYDPEADDPEALAEELCGLHTGVPLTERSVEDSGVLPDHVHLFREGIVNLAGGWNQPRADDEIREEIRITILHELGHHFGLDEDDLAELGYE